MTGHAQCPERIRTNQKIAEYIAMRIVTRGALKVAVPIQSDFRRQRLRRYELTVRRRNTGGVGETNGVIIRKIRSQIRHSRRHVITSHHSYLIGSTQNAPQRNGAIVTAQTQFGCTGGLAGKRVERTRGVYRITRSRQLAIPERSHPLGVVRSVAKNADLRFALSMHGPRPCHGQIMHRVAYALLREERRGEKPNP